MQLRRVDVRNIRSYAAARLDLAPGTTLLIGDVGSGKTSLLYAVEMALFGTAEIDATYLVRHGASEASVSVVLEEGEHRFEVERSFRRVRRRGRETFEPGRISYREDGAATSYSATELRQKVIELLGFRDNPNPRAHSDVWRWAVYVPQEQMREILGAAPADRLATVRRALGVERYHLAAENAKEAARDFRQTAAARRAQAAALREFAEDLEPAALELERVGESLRAAERAVHDLEPAVERAREQLRDTEARSQSVEAARRRMSDLRKEGAIDARRLSELERRASEVLAAQTQTSRSLEATRQLVGDLPARREALELAGREMRERQRTAEVGAVAEATRESAKRLLASREAELARSKEEFTRVGREVADTRAALDQLESEGPNAEPALAEGRSLEQLDTELAGAREREREAAAAVVLAARAVEELRVLLVEGICPRCHKPVDAGEFGAHEAEAGEALRAAQGRLDAQRREVAECQDARTGRERYEREHLVWEARTRRRSDLERRVVLHEEGLLEIEGRVLAARGAAQAAEQAVRALGTAGESVGDLARRFEESERAAEGARRAVEESQAAGAQGDVLRERLVALQGESESLARERAGLADRATTRQVEALELEGRLAGEAELRTALARNRSVLADLETRRHRLAEQLGAAAAHESAARDRLARAERARRERERYDREAETIDSKARWLSEAFHEAVLTMEQRVLERAQAEFQSTFRTYFAALAADPDLVAVTDSYFSPAAEIGGVATPAEALSGGERTSLALAYRLALSRVVRSLGNLRFETLLLDEPTDGFSPEQVQNMGQLFEELRLPQVILVSHERGLDSIADHVVVVEKVDGTSVLRTGAEPAAEAPAPPAT